MALNHWLPGEEVDAADFQMENAEILKMVGRTCEIFFGQSGLQGGLSPLTCTTPDGTTIAIGAPGETCIIGGRQCVDLVTTTFDAVGRGPNGYGVTRLDRIYGAPVEMDVNPFTRTKRNPDLTLDENAVFYQTAHRVAWTYVPGNADGSLGAAPAETTAVAEIAWPVGGGSIANSNITILLPTFASLVNNVLGGVIRAVNGSNTINALTQNGIVTLAAQNVVLAVNGSATIAASTTAGVVTLAVQNVVTSIWTGFTPRDPLRHYSGDISMWGSNEIQLRQDGESAITFVLNAIKTLNGLIGPVSLYSSDGSVGVRASGGLIDLTIASPGYALGSTITRFSDFIVNGRNFIYYSPLPPGLWYLWLTATFDISPPGGSAVVNGDGSSGVTWDAAYSLPQSVATEVTYTGSAYGGSTVVANIYVYNIQASAHPRKMMLLMNRVA